METTKIKIKIGIHEFEAEGPVDLVRDQFEAFRELISSASQDAELIPTTPQANTHRMMDATPESPNSVLEKIVHVAGRVVSLTAIPASTPDSALLIMLGHKEFRNNLSVTGQEIGDGLAQSGRPVPRVDRVMDQTIEDAYVLKTGIKRGTRYRLTNQGLTKALGVAKDLAGSLP